jgi:hypothetical protein
MANQLISTQRQGPRLLDGAQAGGGNRPPRISIDNGRFTLFVPGGKTIPLGMSMDIVIVGKNPHMSKLYWGPPGPNGQRIFDRSNPRPPACWSDNGTAPSAGASEPQNPTCSGCPQNVWGSAINALGKQVKACEDFRKFSCVVKGQPGIYLFEVKAGSFRNWNAFTGMLAMQRLEGEGEPDLIDVVIRVSFAGTGILQFEPVAFTSSDSELTRQALDVSDDTTNMIVNALDRPAQGVLPAAEHRAAEARGVPAQAPMPPPQAQAPFVLSGQAPAGPLFPQQPTPEPDPPKTRGRPKKVEPAPQTQPPAPPPQQVQGIQAPADGLPGGITDRLASLFPKSQA